LERLMASVASKWEWVDHEAHAQVAPWPDPQHAHQVHSRLKAQRTLQLRTDDADAPQPYSPVRAVRFDAPSFRGASASAARGGDGATTSSSRSDYNLKGDSSSDYLCVPTSNPSPGFTYPRLSPAWPGLPHLPRLSCRSVLTGPPAHRTARKTATLPPHRLKGLVRWERPLRHHHCPSTFTSPAFVAPTTAPH
jgi:hypothetical protein